MLYNAINAGFTSHVLLLSDACRFLQVHVVSCLATQILKARIVMQRVEVTTDSAKTNWPITELMVVIILSWECSIQPCTSCCFPSCEHVLVQSL